MSVTVAEPATDTGILEALDIETPCCHTMHNRLGWQHTHNGPATHWIHALHNCTGGAAIYPACAPFVAYVRSMAGQVWQCPNCPWSSEGSLMAYVVGPVT